MCGIAGFIGFENNNELAAIANKIQQHRGPDNQSIWADDYLSFAHQRLSIIDLSEAGNQPFHKHNLVMVFNGEIYNYKELQQKLEKERNVKFVSSSDTEVVLEMYKEYGTDSLDFLIGMFAFAIYNKDSGELFLVRDHFGIKPVFYTEINGAFAFSSELKTLVNLPGFNKSINHKAVVSSLNYRWVSGNDTMFKDCYKLPPAHYIRLKKGGHAVVTKYWDLVENVKQSSDEAKLADEISNSVEMSVGRHMVADVPVSSFLSGGLDLPLFLLLLKKQIINYQLLLSALLVKIRK